MTPSNFSLAGKRVLVHAGCQGQINVEGQRLVCGACATVIGDPREILNPTVPRHEQERIEVS